MRSRCYFSVCLVFGILGEGVHVHGRALCPYPKKFENGGFKRMNRYEGGFVTFECEEGYWYTGNITRQCQSDGTWTGRAGTCKAIDCGILPEDPHGAHLYYTGQGYNDSVTITCDPGYNYTKPQYRTRVCQDNNKWDGEDGVCEVITCSNLTQPQNGHIEMPSRDFNTSATFTCKEGYTYTGNTTRICLKEGVWSGQPGTCQVKHCPIFAEVRNAMNSTTGHRYKDNITILCHTGLHLYGSSKITCQADGTWSSDLGQCRIKEISKLYWLLLVIPVVLVLLLGGVLVWMRRKRTHFTQVPVNEYEITTLLCPVTGSLKRKVHHCYFTMKDDIPIGEQMCDHIEQWIQKMLNSGTNAIAEVRVTCLSRNKRKVFLDISCQNSLRETRIDHILQSSPKEGDVPGHIIPGSVKFNDIIKARLAVEIIRNKDIRDNELDRLIDLETQYVRLKILSKTTINEMERDALELPDKYQLKLEKRRGTEIIDEDLINAEETGAFVLVRGRAGIGKTTLIQRLLWRWAHGEWATHLKAIFLLNLRVLMTSDRKLNLSSILSYYTTYGKKILVRSSWLEDSQHHLGIILDGLDEVQNIKERWTNMDPLTDLQEEGDPLSWCLSLMKRECLPRASLIVTSRPFKDLSLLEPKTTRLVELMGLTRDRVLDFVDRNVQQERKKMVKQTLEASPILMSVCSITFYCAVLCQVLGDDVTVLRGLRTYTQITAYITDTFIDRSKKELKDSDSLPEVFKSLCQLAYSGLISETNKGLTRLVFDEKDLEDNNLLQDDVTAVVNSGLFMETKTADMKVLGQFTHLSIQELLGMVGLLSQNPDRFKKVLRTFGTSGQFNMSLLFLYGLAFNARNGQILKLCSRLGLRPETKEDVRKTLVDSVVGVSDKLQALQIVHESQSPELARTVGENSFSDEISIVGTKLTVLDVMALTFLLMYHHLATSIRLVDVGLDLVCLRYLSGFLKGNTNVKKVVLWDSGISDEGVEHLAHAFTENRTIRNLWIQSDTVTDEGVKHLADMLTVNQSLQTLQIQSESITDEAVKHLAAMLTQNKILQALQFRSDSITDEGSKHLADMLRENRALQTLQIQSDTVTDEGAGYLADMLTENKSLQMLQSDRITDAGVKYFAEVLPDNRSLQTLHLSGLTVSEDGAKALLEGLKTNSTIKVKLELLKCSMAVKEELLASDRVTF